MTAVTSLASRFVDVVPEELEPGVFYVSLEHASMMHLCACGCDNEVALPLSPLDWRFTYDGEAVSVSPSVGSWSLPCRSHYIIDRGCIRWAAEWTDEEIEAGRRRDRRRRETLQSAAIVSPAPAAPAVEAVPDQYAIRPSKRGIFDGLLHWLGGLWGRP